MNKPLGLLFAVTSIIWMTLCAISLNYNGWAAAIFFVLCIANIGLGFTVKARIRRKNQNQA
ncbi:DUF5325 domain-containing protein [Cohnella lubricantis]|uniref:DUF5325 family protein n=1 Tax=Cohnella lubricantis TaxID=2163172 RepID=A0A841TDZ6_9BACL|nr:DUF5325 family protein [Cohnella lubricantis]MBB6678265.1 DUF5325 family protein [Cohnella lubricantis]MBP2118466.1 FtsH-binding integral membrane protein [Cohnella lubricantis]